MRSGYPEIIDELVPIFLPLSLTKRLCGTCFLSWHLDNHLILSSTMSRWTTVEQNTRRRCSFFVISQCHTWTVNFTTNNDPRIQGDIKTTEAELYLENLRKRKGDRLAKILSGTHRLLSHTLKWSCSTRGKRPEFRDVELHPVEWERLWVR